MDNVLQLLLKAQRKASHAVVYTFSYMLFKICGEHSCTLKRTGIESIAVLLELPCTVHCGACRLAQLFCVFAVFGIKRYAQTAMDRVFILSEFPWL